MITSAKIILKCCFFGLGLFFWQSAADISFANCAVVFAGAEKSEQASNAAPAAEAAPQESSGGSSYRDMVISKRDYLFLPKGRSMDDVDLMVESARAYMNLGQERRINYIKAAALARKAALAGSEEGAGLLVKIFDKGGIIPDAEDIQLLRELAFKGHSDVRSYLAVWYRMGKYVPLNISEALSFIVK